MNAGFETGDLTGWYTPAIEYYLVEKAEKFSGQYGLYCKPPRWTYYIEQVLEIPIQVKYLTHFSFYAYAYDPEIVNSLVRCRCIYTDATYTEHDFTIPWDGKWHECNMLPYLDKTKSLRTIRIYILEVAGKIRETWLDDFILILAPPRFILGAKGLSINITHPYGWVNPESEVTIFDIPLKHVEFQSLQIGFNNDTWLSIRLYAYDEEGALIPYWYHIIIGYGSADVTPVAVREYGSDIFNLRVDDPTIPAYTLELKRSLEFPSGAKIVIRNGHGTASYWYRGCIMYAIHGE